MGFVHTVRILASIFIMMNASFSKASAPLSIETWTSRSTLLGPEVHVLLTNLSSEELTVDVYLPRKVVCPQSNKPRPPGIVKKEAIRLSLFHASTSSQTTVPPGKWVHRSLPFGLYPALPYPCEVSIMVLWKNSSENGQQTAEISIQRSDLNDPRYPYEGKPELSALSMVERVPNPPNKKHMRSIRQQPDSDLKGEENEVMLITTLLVKNNSEHHELATILRDQIHCENDAPVRRILYPQFGPFQGEDYGPTSIGPDSYGAFVIAPTIASSNPEKCKIVLILAVYRRGIPQIVDRYEIPLKPMGFRKLTIDGAGA